MAFRLETTGGARTADAVLRCQPLSRCSLPRSRWRHRSTDSGGGDTPPHTLGRWVWQPNAHVEFWMCSTGAGEGRVCALVALKNANSLCSDVKLKNYQLCKSSGSQKTTSKGNWRQTIKSEEDNGCSRVKFIVFKRKRRKNLPASYDWRLLASRLIECDQMGHWRQTPESENVHKMVLWMGLSVCMVTNWGKGICVCVEDTEKERGALASLHANKKPKAYLQYVIAAAQLGGSFLSLWQDWQQKVTAPALVPVTEIRNHCACARRGTPATNVCVCVSSCRFAFHSRFFFLQSQQSSVGLCSQTSPIPAQRPRRAKRPLTLKEATWI